MSPGKVGAQTAHGATMAARTLSGTPDFEAWYHQTQKKIILEAKSSKMEALLEAVPGSVKVVDNGLTEIPSGSMTVVVLPPMTREEASPFVRRLQLLRSGDHGRNR